MMIVLLEYIPTLQYNPSELVATYSLRKNGDTQLFVDHKGEDTHLGGPSVVELDGALL